jgi:hypothetical protein
MKEHRKNLQALKEMMLNIGNERDRKKNKFDPLNNPVRIFRGSLNEAKKLSINDFIKKNEALREARNKKNETMVQLWFV